MGRFGRAVLTAGLAATAGCGKEEPGFYWELDQALVDDSCNPTPVSPPSDPLEYRLQIDVNDLVVAMGEDEFATGVAQGCNISYETVVWPEEDDDGFEIHWKMTGSATISRGGTDGCSVDGDTDWAGTEVFTIITSEDPDLSPGCTYTVSLTGLYTKEVK